MDIRQGFVMAMKNLRANRLRLVQTMLGLVIGVAAVTAILVVEQGMVNRINASYQEFSPSLMMMGTYRPVDSSQNFTEEDMERVAAANPEYISSVSPMRFLQGAVIQYEGQTYEDFGAMGVGDRFMEVSPLLHLAEGRFLQPLEISREQRVCVVTQMVADEVLGGDALGKSLRISGENFQVVGVIAEVVDDQGQFNGAIYIPYTIAKKMQPDQIITMAEGSGFSGDYYFTQYYVNANGIDNIANARIAVQQALEEVYGEDTIHYSASFRYFRERELAPILSAAKKLLAAAGVVLLVGGVGIMNILLAAVAERRPEIGVRKAFGARRRDIRRQFIIEAASTSLVGGLLGIGLGLAGSLAACQVLQLPVKMQGLPLLPVLAAFALTVAVGVIFGAYPASKAARQEIVAALRPE